jgi:hypothetical protein
MKNNEDNINSVFLYLIGSNTVILKARYLSIFTGNDLYSKLEETELHNILTNYIRKRENIDGNIFIGKRFRFQKFIFRINII